MGLEGLGTHVALVDGPLVGLLGQESANEPGDGKRANTASRRKAVLLIEGLNDNRVAVPLLNLDDLLTDLVGTFGTLPHP